MRKRGNLRALAIIIGVLMLATVAGCGSDDDKTKTGEGATAGATGDAAGGFAVEAGKKRSPQDAKSDAADPEPPPVQVLVGNETGVRVNEPTVIVVRSEKEFKALEKRQFSKGTDKQSILSTDYKNRQILGLFLPKSPKGTLLTITSVAEENGNIVVKAVKIIPGKGCDVGDYVARPFHIVETRKMAGTPKIELSDMKQPAC